MPEPCPMCGRPLRPLPRTLHSVVVREEGATRARYDGPGEVVGRSPLRVETVAGRREVVQDLEVWDGVTVRSAWAPFCASQCAARFGVETWRAGVRPVEHGGVEVEPPALPAPDLAARMARLIEHVAEPEVQSRAANRIERQAEAGHGAALIRNPIGKYWQPPGKPAPVPGLFRYDAGGYRISDTPEANEARRQKAAVARLSLPKRRPMDDKLQPWKEFQMTAAQWRDLPDEEQRRLRQRAHAKRWARANRPPKANGQHRPGL